MIATTIQLSVIILDANNNEGNLLVDHFEQTSIAMFGAKHKASVKIDTHDIPDDIIPPDADDCYKFASIAQLQAIVNKLS